MRVAELVEQPPEPELKAKPADAFSLTRWLVRADFFKSSI